eukprot:gb/GECG01016393.1/.p1 GENE.gb/GECG01016393.1/~~gb/GECG01016393.1/.p1  ORF type:complete len:394 (+),score=42.26 gb/GECG01016393.1/:1-1182(+)
MLHRCTKWSSSLIALSLRRSHSKGLIVPLGLGLNTVLVEEEWVRVPGNRFTTQFFSTATSKMDGSTDSELEKAREFGATPFSVDIPGLTIAGLQWGDPDSPDKIVCLHGWKDNAATWVRAAGELSQRGYHIVSLDFAGHGNSSHRREDTPYIALLYAIDVLECLKAMRWISDDLKAPDTHRVFLLGHSLGGAIASIVSGTLHDQLSGVVYVEALGILAKSEDQGPESLRNAVVSSSVLRSKSTKYYNSLEEAIKARCEAVRAYPGHQFLTKESAYPIVKRGVKEEAASQRVQFKHDMRLSERSPIYLSEEQACAYLDSTKSPMLLVTAGRGWPYSRNMMEHRLQRIKKAATYFQAEHYEKAGHHLHLEPDTAPEITSKISLFLEKCRDTSTKL